MELAAFFSVHVNWMKMFCVEVVLAYICFVFFYFILSRMCFWILCLENLYHKKKTMIFAYICKNTPQNLNDQKYFWWRGWELGELFSFTMGEGWVLNKIYIFSIIYSQTLPPLVHDQSPSKIVLMEFDDIRMIHNDLQRMVMYKR
jgi:hypothetical protein